MKFIRKGNETVIQVSESERIPYLFSPSFDQTGLVKHLFTTRIGGVSKEELSSLNLSYSRGDRKENVDENFKRVAEVFHKTINDFVLSDQTHTTNIRVVTAADIGKGITKKRDYHDIDGLITNQSGIILATFFADCVPLFFLDPKHHAIGLSHSGWKGTALRMGEKTLQKMQETFQTDPKDVLVLIGPSICADCYEVSDDVAQCFEKEFMDSAALKEIVTPNKNGKFQLDLWKANETLLLEAGIQKKNLTITDICTCCNKELLFSHRGSHGKRGNLGAFLMLN